MDLFMHSSTINAWLPLLAIISAFLVIITNNPIYSVLNLIILYILVAFYLIFKGITYIGISYIIIYVGAIAILFLFILMMIDIEVVEKKNNNYLPLLCILLVGSVFLLKNIVIKYGLIKHNNLYTQTEKIFYDKNNNVFENENEIEKINNLNGINNEINEESIDLININTNLNKDILIDTELYELFIPSRKNSPEILLNIQEDININIDNNININYDLNESFDVSNWFIIKDLLVNENSHLLMFVPDWENAVSRITQISAIGDIIYSIYHSFIYILSVILLLGMIGAIILTTEKNEEIKIVSVLKKKKKNFGIPIFLSVNYIEELGSEGIIDSFSYFVFIVLFIGILLFAVNSYLSLSMKYLDKEGGFECGFTSFVQTRERFNIIFYRVALLFLIFDLEIILIFPYTALYHSNQSISKNNVLAFLYILVIGFIFELKEGALDIVKKAHPQPIK
jgi:NADH:ubiquinone oxidoreductase subunit 6 (subunit J)/NADH:ubiquinone oxidoreductase subunit 3 (subunit A)